MTHEPMTRPTTPGGTRPEHTTGALPGRANWAVRCARRRPPVHALADRRAPHSSSHADRSVRRPMTNDLRGTGSGAPEVGLSVWLSLLSGFGGQPCRSVSRAGQAWAGRT